jgi:NitT/TauT family transport system substrate-binding protein
MRGKKVGVWCCGNQPELFAALTKNGINPAKKSDVTIINQPFDMNLFLQKKVDAAAAMTYNELAQVLETKNPATGKLYTLSDLNVLKMQNQGTGMLEDGVFVQSDWIASAKNQDIAKRFLAATFQGWAYCRDHMASCVNIVLQNGPTLGKGHQTWQMNEINAIAWPAPLGVGVMSTAAFNRTAAIAKTYKVIKKLPSGAYRTDLAKAAVAMDKAKGINVWGLKYKKAVVPVTPGGK